MMHSMNTITLTFFYITQITFGDKSVTILDPRISSQLYKSEWFANTPEIQLARLEEILAASPDSPQWIKDITASLPAEPDYS